MSRPIARRTVSDRKLYSSRTLSGVDRALKREQSRGPQTSLIKSLHNSPGNATAQRQTIARDGEDDAQRAALCCPLHSTRLTHSALHPPARSGRRCSRISHAARFFRRGLSYIDLIQASALT